MYIGRGENEWVMFVDYVREHCTDKGLSRYANLTYPTNRDLWRGIWQYSHEHNDIHHPQTCHIAKQLLWERYKESL